MNRIVSVYLFLLEFLNMHKIPESYKVIGTQDRILYGYSFRNITGILEMNQCLAKCLEDCKCLSFQICEDENMCQLCSSNREQNERSFQLRKGCTSFVFERKQLLQTSTSVQKSCLKDINCCLTSQPCENGTSCVPTNPTTSTNNRPRFTCKCRPGYQGLHCEQPIRSCRGYINKTNQNDNYYVIDSKGNAFPVLCRFKLSKAIIWTLIQSYNLEHRATLVRSFKNKSSNNEDDPKIVPYRLSSFRMEYMRQNSTKWRIIHGNDKEGQCWDITSVDIDVQKKKCTNCETKMKIHNQTKSRPKECNLSNYGVHECKDAQDGGNIDNYGLYCCFNSTFNQCPSGDLKLNNISRIWLGEKL